MHQYKKVFSSSTIVFTGLVIRIALIMLFEILAARYLGPEKYGTFSLAFTIIIILSTIPTLGLIQSVRRFIALFKDQDDLSKVKGIVHLSMLWTFIGGVILILIALLLKPLLNSSSFASSDTPYLISLLIVIVPFFAVRKIAISVFSGFKHSIYKVLLEDIIEPGMRIVTILLVIALTGSILELVYLTIAGYILLGIISISLIFRSYHIITKEEFKTDIPWRVFFGFSGAMIISELIELILSWIDIIMLGILSSDQQIGLFRAASQPAMLASTILTSFAFIYMPIATEHYRRNNKSEWGGLNNLISLWSMTLAFPISAVCIAYPETVIDLLFGQDFIASKEVLRVLGISYLFHSACGFTGLNLIIGDKSKIQMTGKVLSLLLHTLLNIWLIPMYGAYGAAISILLSIVFSNFYNLGWTNYFFKINPFDTKYFLLLLVNTVSASALFITLGYIDIHNIVKMLVLGIIQLPLAIMLSMKLKIIERKNVLIIFEWIASIRSTK